MIKVSNIDVWGFEHAIRGMRNPKNSWDRSDSVFTTQGDNTGTDCPCDCPLDIPEIGTNDLKLMKNLYKGGTEHRKYARQIMVSMDITAPLYFYKEWDTYKVGTVANSCSTMHKIHDKEFTLDDFSCEHLVYWDVNDNVYNPAIPMGCISDTVKVLNACREKYLETKDKFYWWQMIQLLPSSYNQKRTVTFSYENVFTMIKQRSGHKLDEWREFVEVLKGLPYVEVIISD